MTKRQKWGITLIISPFAILFLTAFAQIATRIALTKSEPVRNLDNSALCQSLDGECEQQANPTNVPKAVMNIISVLLGVIAVIGFVPSIVVGIVLLSTPGKTSENPPPDQTLPPTPTT
jgi:hypothetical protein